ncbi:STAS domain-containing protein [Actinophytocola oryzae]|uniref:Anti-sigma factor antagonist n=1 Tax=Actinophytocola oryzae TaxID=502181 RepID=A0A4R7VAW8_9PSEU|nr:STAS domain-containing protein [Actinophytocola oryzae]TDV46087.1 anti-anti-sigma factor [Actinophytocola oryzae]
MSNPVQLRTERPGPNCVLLSVLGEIDLVTVTGLETAVAEHVAAAPTLVIDLSEVTFFGSVGLAAIMRAMTLAEDRGTRLLLVAGRRVRRTMELTKTTEFFAMYDSVEQALRHT